MTTACRERLAELIAQADLLGRQSLAPVIGKLVTSEYAPWGVELERGGVVGQRAFIRSSASIRIVVAGRQGGKTHAAAEEVVRICMERPGTESCLLMPNYKSSKGALRHLNRALKPLKGGYAWREVDKCFVFRNGAKLYIRTADDKTGVPTRGLTLDGVLWIDEASYIPRAAWTSALPTLGAVADPLVIITTTPKGRGSWVFQLCKDSRTDDGIEFFRFRTTDSPHHNAEFVKRLRRTLGRKRADEELNAVFVGGSSQPFRVADVDAAIARGRGKKLRGKRLTIGLDLAKAKDFTAVVIMNEFQEAWLLDRFRAKRNEDGELDQRFWETAFPRILAHCKRHKAMVVVDEAHGGGVGGSMADRLTSSLGEEWVRRVRTGNPRFKAKLIEELIADFEVGAITLGDHEGLHLSEDAATYHLHDELRYFPPAEMVEKNGIPEKVYKGPAPEERYINADGDEEELHDDTLIALVLARWGSVHEWDHHDPLAGDVSAFAEQALGQGGNVAADDGWGAVPGSEWSV